jgi:hypothetical protein
MIHWNYMLPAAGALLVFLLYHEWKRKNRARLYGRLTASLLAVTSLLFMAYPYAGNNSGVAVKKIILLTDGFIKDSLEHFLQQTNIQPPVFSAIPERWNISGKPVQLVTNWNAFAARHAADTLHVFGNGVSKEILAMLHPHPIVFHASPVLPAITHIYWKQQLQPGEPLAVQGHYENNTHQKIKIVLQAFGTDKDTVFMDAFAGRDFTLHTIPVQMGRAVYAIIVTAGKDTLEKEPVPVEVQQASPIQLLIISSSPDFENTFLKNNLSQQGYQITVTTTISTNKTGKQFLNTPLQQQGKLTVPYLNKFDVVMADEEALREISAAERAAIRSVVSEKGTGLVIRMDAEKKAAAFYSPFFPVKNLQQEKQSYLLLRGTVTGSNRYKIKITDPVTIAPVPGTQIILQDDRSGIFVCGTVYGSGKIIATTLQNTYSIALAGDKASYQQLWWLLLNKAARKIYPAATWQVYPFISYVNNPVELQAEQNDAAVSRAVLQETSIYLKQDGLLPFLWKGRYWPSAGGWQPLPQLNAATGGWFVYKKGDWKRLTDYDQVRATEKYAALHPVSFEHASNQRAFFLGINRPLLMLLVFLSCCIFLWVEQKTG